MSGRDAGATVATGSKGAGGGNGTGPQSGQQNKTFAALLGEVTWILSQSPIHRNLKIADLEWLVMPALILQQVRIFYQQAQPVGVAFWAYLNKEAEERLAKDGKLKPDDWPEDKRGGGKLRRVMAQGMKDMTGQDVPVPDQNTEGEDTGTLWLVELIAPAATVDNKLTDAMLSDLKTNVFPNEKLKFHHTDLKTGDRKVVEV
jgi:cytolysin-activating lysine-acyltransferase